MQDAASELASDSELHARVLEHWNSGNHAESVRLVKAAYNNLRQKPLEPPDKYL